MFDVLIIGAGPAGLTASIYAARSNVKVGIIEQASPGGQMVNTAFIENYPGYKKIDGPDLSFSMFQQATDLGVEYIGAEVTDIEKKEDIFVVTCSDGNIYESITLIVATGTKNKKLGVPGENKFEAYGISWCAICDGNFYKGKDVAVIGGGNSALEEAIYLSSIVRKVYIIHRRDEFRGEEKIVERLKNIENVEFILNSQVKEFIGDNKLRKLRIVNTKENKEFELEVEGCFEYVGQNPATDLVKKFDVLDNRGYILVDSNQETIIKGMFAAGDVIAKTIRQITTATNDGTIAALNACKYIE